MARPGRGPRPTNGRQRLSSSSGSSPRRSGGGRRPAVSGNAEPGRGPKRAPHGALGSPPYWASVLDEGALALVEGAIGLVARHGGDQLVDVVLALGLGRRLDLEEVHVADQAAVLTQLAVLGHDVVYWDLAHLG